MLFSFQIGINPGLMAAYIGRWFPGPGNHFCKLCDKYQFELCNGGKWLPMENSFDSVVGL